MGGRREQPPRATPGAVAKADTFPPLFYCAPLPDVVGERVTLTGDEASHALGARRLQVGGDIGLFDGQGTAARAVVTAVDRRRHTLEAKLTDRQRMPNPRPAVHLACALPKGDRAAVLLDMATQLGMVRFTPLVCTRSVVKPGANSRERLRRICLEACKQSRRFYLPEIEAPASPRELARRVPPGNLWVAHPTTDVPAAFIGQQTNTLTLLIGPEGGFTPQELAEVMAAGARPFSLGPAILRIETAAVAALAAATLGAR